jgi:RNA polymerase sigma-70 factor, ECF subfamily
MGFATRGGVSLDRSSVTVKSASLLTPARPAGKSEFARLFVARSLECTGNREADDTPLAVPASPNGYEWADCSPRRAFREHFSEPSIPRSVEEMKATLPVPMVELSEQAASRSDEDLLLAYRDSRDPELFAELVRRYERELFSYLRRYLGDAEMAEDAFQAAFLQVHLKCQQYEPGRAFRPWLYTIATNQAIDAQRRSRRHRMVSLDRAGPVDGEDVGKLLDLLTSKEVAPLATVSSDERRSWLHEAVEQLPPGLRDVVRLVYFQELKYREAADALQIPVGTVKSRMHAAVAKLNEAWNQSSLASS